MQYFKLFLLSAVLPFLLGSCTKKHEASKPITGDYIIMGHGGGFVASPDVTYYLLNNATLTEDTGQKMGSVPDNISGFHFTVTAPASKYAAVKDMLTNIPSELKSRNNQTIGRLVVDAGYYDIRASIDGVVYKWDFEEDLSGESAAIQQFVAIAHQAVK